jgi:hypothetical protein
VGYKVTFLWHKHPLCLGPFGLCQYGPWGSIILWVGFFFSPTPPMPRRYFWSFPRSNSAKFQETRSEVWIQDKKFKKRVPKFLIKVKIEIFEGETGGGKRNFLWPGWTLSPISEQDLIRNLFPLVVVLSQLVNHELRFSYFSLHFPFLLL